MRSMTGYGRGECTLYNRKFIAEIKSVNHRYNDITVKVPKSMISFEDYIKKIVCREIFRGKTDVFISLETYAKNDIKIKLNELLADSYVNALKNIKIRSGAKDDISVGLIANFPEVLTIERTPFENKDEISEPLFNAVKSALASFVEMRTIEGEVLKENIINKLDIIYSKVKKINSRVPDVEKAYKKRLLDRIEELNIMDFDENRILTEVALFAEKTSIDEEITRLLSHIAQMRVFLEESEPIGRKLDFLIQEMNRETNTISSKTTDLNITSIVVDIKSELEKVREQIQNIE